MRAILAVFLLVSVSNAAPARAESVVQYDAAPLQRCISAAGVSAPALEACKGDGAAPCIAAEGGATIALTLCWDEEAQTWQDVMDATEARVRAARPQIREALAAARDAWENWVETECAYRASAYDGGSGAQVEHTQCAATLTADRAIRLIQTEHD